MLCVYIYKSSSFDFIKQFDFIQTTIMELRKRIRVHTQNQMFTFALCDELTMQKLASKLKGSDVIFLLSDGTIIDDIEWFK